MSASSSPLTGDTPLSREGASFLRDFVLRTEQLAQPSEVDAAEIARFRLLATVVRNDGNDEVALGVHDANLLYSQRKKFMFGARERSGLLNAALEHYDNENVPLWHWLASLGGFDKHILPFYSLLAGSDKRRQNAIAAMRIIGESVPDDSPGRKQFVMFWLSDATPDPVRVKALEYLGERGTTADLPPIREELKRGNSQTSGLAANAIVRITLRDSREAAVRALFELQPSIVDGRLVHELFENHSVLSTELLQVGLDQANVNVRRTVVELLGSRGALSPDIAEKLLADSDLDIRYEALKVLQAHGRVLSEREAKAILAKPVVTNTLSRLFIPYPNEGLGHSVWERFKLERLRSLPDLALEQAVTTNSGADRSAWFVLVERHFKRYRKELRQAVDDGFRLEVATEQKGATRLWWLDLDPEVLAPK